MSEEVLAILMIAFLAFIGLIIHFLPALIGMGKKHSGAIFVLNLLTGWTIVGWVAAFIWACVSEDEWACVANKPKIKIWARLFIGVACLTALFNGLATLIAIFTGYKQGSYQFSPIDFLDVGLAWLLGIGMGWKKSRVCALLAFSLYVGGRFIYGLDESAIMLAITIGTFYLLGIVGTFAYQHQIKRHHTPLKVTG